MTGPTRTLIRVDGTEVELHGPHALDDIRQMLGAEALDVIRLADHTYVMLVDKKGSTKKLLPNHVATQYYRERCFPGGSRQIMGDAVIVPHTDYARLE